jgi:AcrR family transcriptional regulator
MSRTSTNPSGINNGRPFRAQDEQAAKHQRIVAAALKLFAHEPYQAVTMDRVAQTAGVAKGTLYLYFQSKDALYLGVLSDGLDTAYRTYQSSTDPRLPVVERLRRSIELMVEFYDQRRDFLQFFASVEPRLADARNRIIETWRDRGFNFFAALVEEGIRSGVFPRIDPRLASLTIHGAIRSLLLYYGAGRPVSDLSRELGNLLLRSLGADLSPHFNPEHPQ